ncbi:MAG: YqgE/AlgH family protein [Thermodesulfobacteriota bacterium]
MNCKGTFLIAMPGMMDPRFARTVVFICEHSSDGAMGLIVNKPMTGITFVDICRQVGAPLPEGTGPRVYYGGPVSPENGFILHTGVEGEQENTLRVSPSLFLSADRSLLTAISEGRGPQRFLFALGYSGWGPGQLEDEIRDDGWLVVPGEDPVIFDLADDLKWKSAAQRNGIDLDFFSLSGGNA